LNAESRPASRGETLENAYAKAWQNRVKPIIHEMRPLRAEDRLR
jgi:hypothetical protein